MTNRNQGLIDEVVALEQKVAALQPEKGERDPFVSVAVGGLHTCRDNLTWHGAKEVENPKSQIPNPKGEAAKK